MTHAELFNKLWAEKYAPDIANQMAREAERRAEAFANIPVTVCGEELRLMTPRDLLFLDGLDNPLVTGKRIAEKEDVAFFLWQLSTRNKGPGLMTSWHRGRLYGRILDPERDVAVDVAQIELYCERVFIGLDISTKDETPTGLEQKPPQVYFLAPLLVRVSGKMGAHDPMDGRLLADTPIPRLLQYQRAIDADDPENKDANFSEFDSARSRCLEEVNQLMAQQTA